MTTYSDQQQRELDAESGAEMDRRAARWHFPPEAFPAMRHISSALPPAAIDALRLADASGFLSWWGRLDSYLAIHGETPAMWNETARLWREGWCADAAAHEIADRRAAR